MSPGQFGFLSYEVEEGKKLFFHMSEVEGGDVLQVNYFYSKDWWYYWKFNFPMNPHVRLLLVFFWSVVSKFPNWGRKLHFHARIGGKWLKVLFEKLEIGRYWIETSFHWNNLNNLITLSLKRKIIFCRSVTRWSSWLWPTPGQGRTRPAASESSGNTQTDR